MQPSVFSEHEGHHPVSAGPAHPAVHAGPAGLDPAALGLQSSADSSAAAPGEHQQVSLKVWRISPLLSERL